MSKKCKKETAKHVDRSVKNSDSEKIAKNPTNASALDAIVGTSNVNQWNELREAFSCKSNVEFATVLLNLAEEQLNNRRTNNTTSTPPPTLSNQNEEKPPSPALVPLGDTKVSIPREKITQLLPKKLQIPPKEDISEVNPSKPNEETDNFHVYDLNSLAAAAAENLVDKNSILVHHLFSGIRSPIKREVEGVDAQKENSAVKNKKTRSGGENLGKVAKKAKSSEAVEKGKKVDHDTRKAPELMVQVENNVELQNFELKTEEEEAEKRLAIKIKLCSVCNTHHLQDCCSLQNPQSLFLDSLTLPEWQRRFKPLLDEKPLPDPADATESDMNLSFAVISLPSILHLKENNSSWGVFAKESVKAHAQFGPLIGRTVREVDIPEDSGLQDYWEVQSEQYHGFVCTESLEEANWMRFVRPAPTREDRNVTVVCRNDELYFVTVKDVQGGDELLFWQDSSVVSNKKKMEKTSCGGCNMTFTHPLYYRLHCSVFHDVRYSLTIRKYHCKVCGAAVLGKENIMKHALELHNGQGAYQCQFCKKFFMRLNYLEMHRTYGCSANPHRSRPLCDFCGRKFCQPQKLKVHIKRMHSDMSEVLKEFQCKNCMKILGSRAALQRHVKEVHQKQMEGACTCSRCGKLFQNKSNLKIHMLTHSGIKPFKCGQNECKAAFTTKQCLQFHYKKVHGFAENEMPKIERSVDYTFEAYSGVEDGEVQGKSGEKMSEYSTQNSVLTVEDCSDIDSASVDDRNMDDPPPLQSPGPLPNDLSNSNTSPAILEPYNAPSTTLETPTTTTTNKVLSKGSKKWIGDHQVFPTRMEDTSNSIEVDECPGYEAAKVTTTSFSGFNRHESNASLLVEAALDSVCSESNIDMDVTTVANNLYTLAHPDTLQDYNQAVNDSRDINLISPSVNDQISVTDDLKDDLRHNYTSFHQDDFTPSTSPSKTNNFVGDYISTVSPEGIENYETDRSKNVSPISSPPRYDFNAPPNGDHLSSDDSNGAGAQNLSLHDGKNNDMQLDLSIYKSPYFRMKFDGETERNKQVYLLEMNGDENLMGQPPDLGEGLPGDDVKLKEAAGLERYKYSGEQTNLDFRSKFELDLDLRIKSYDNLEAELRNRNYEGLCDANDFRIKNYDVDALDSRNKPYEGLIEGDFRAERGLEPLLLNPTEIQGLDMSARNYHNYPNLNRYHHLYSEVDRPSVDLRMNYSPPQPSYTHADILRVVSLDLTPPGRHSVDLSLRQHPLHQIANTRLLSEHALQTNPHRLLDQSRLLNTDLNGARHLGEARILSDHTANRLLSNDQMLANRLLSDEQSRLLDQSRLMGEGRLLSGGGAGGGVSPPPPVQYSGYPVSPSPYHPTPLPPRPHATSPTPANYHHYSYY